MARARLSKSALERRAWSKFGDAAHEDASSRLTMVSTEEIVLERPRAPGSKVEEPKAAEIPLLLSEKLGLSSRCLGLVVKRMTTGRLNALTRILAQPSDTFIDKRPLLQKVYQVLLARTLMFFEEILLGSVWFERNIKRKGNGNGIGKLMGKAHIV